MSDSQKKKGFLQDIMSRFQSGKTDRKEDAFAQESTIEEQTPALEEKGDLEISGGEVEPPPPEKSQPGKDSGDIEQEKVEREAVTVMESRKETLRQAFLNKIAPSIFKKREEEIKISENGSRLRDEPSEKEQKKENLFDKLKPSKWFQRLKEQLDKTRKSFVFKMMGLFRLRNVIDEDFWDELEEILITADVGLDTSNYLIKEMKKSVNELCISEPSHLLEVLKDKLAVVMEEKPVEMNLKKDDLSVIMVVGVNGTGKTTSIAKIANYLMQENKKVIIAAADTFRAAAIDQLEVWSRKIGLELIKHKEGSDPAAVVFDAISAAKARKADVLIIDTAGRLHSKVNLMKELEKIKRVIQRNIPDGPHETLLVLDATTGQNAIAQAKTFGEFVDLSGIILAKLDGTAKGGIIIGIVHDLGIPVKFIGIGEGVYDLRPFEPKSFLDALFSDSEEYQSRQPTVA